MVSNASGVMAELERILESKWLRESHQLSLLLRHIVEETLAGRTEGLKEYSLGLEVFHRPPDYDPRNDAIVRVQASQLRKRLASYYGNEGRVSPLQITLPRGGYIPEFVEVKPAAAVAAPGAPPDSDVATAPRLAPRWAVFAVGVLAGAASLLMVGWWSRNGGGVTPAESPALWSGYLQPGVETVVGFGVPLFFSGGGGLYVRDTQVNKRTDSPERVDRIGGALGRGFQAQEDVYTGIGDAIGSHLVARWLEQHGVPATVANSNYIGPSDYAGKNLVVVSSARFQTMLQPMGLPDRMPFEPVGFGGGYRLLDPLPGEQAEYRPGGTEAGVNLSYAVVSLWPGTSPGRRILYLSGVETWSTQGAAMFAIDPEQLTALQERLDEDPPDGPRGRKSPFFQVLLQVEGKNNQVRSVTYITHRYLPETQPLQAGKR
jgi:hypothetical protein